MGSDDDDASSDNDKFIDSSKKFGVKSMKTAKRDDARQTGKEIDSEKVLKAARRVTGAADSDSESSSDTNSVKQPIVASSKPNKKKSEAKATGFTTVEFGEEDLQHLNADKDKLIKDEMIAGKVSSNKPGADKQK